MSKTFILNFLYRSVAIILLLSVAGNLCAKQKPLTIECMYMLVDHNWGSQYTCFAIGTVVNDADTSVTDANGIHLMGKGDGDVRAIVFERQKMTYLPMNISTPFPNLVGLRVGSSGLKFLTSGTFKGQEELKYIEFYDNKIEDFPKNMFSNLMNLEWLTIVKCRLRNLDSDMLTGLTQLRTFSVSENIIETLGSGLFRDNTNLKKIFFNGNDIRMVGSKLVSNLISLEEADFEGNVCTVMSFKNDSRMREMLTKEFIQRCSVDCSKAYQISRNQIWRLKNKLNQDKSTNCQDEGFDNTRILY